MHKASVYIYIWIMGLSLFMLKLYVYLYNSYLGSFRGLIGDFEHKSKQAPGPTVTNDFVSLLRLSRSHRVLCCQGRNFEVKKWEKEKKNITYEKTIFYIEIQLFFFSLSLLLPMKYQNDFKRTGILCRWRKAQRCAIDWPILLALYCFMLHYICDHDDAGTPTFLHHEPKISLCGWQRALQEGNGDRWSVTYTYIYRFKRQATHINQAYYTMAQQTAVRVYSAKTHLSGYKLRAARTHILQNTLHQGMTCVLRNVVENREIWSINIIVPFVKPFPKL